MSKRFIITEDEKRSILGQYGLLKEGYDEATKTYTTEEGMLWYGEGGSEGQTVWDAYKVRIPKGSKVTATIGEFGKPAVKVTGKYQGQSVPTDNDPEVEVRLHCDQNGFVFYTPNEQNYRIQLHSQKKYLGVNKPLQEPEGNGKGMTDFANKMKGLFCKTEKTQNVTPNVTPTVKQVMDCKNGLYFKKGMKGDGVKELQKLLGMIDYKYLDIMRGGSEKLVEDGNFGSNTDKAVKQFQTDNPPLKSDGLVGCNTMKKIYQVYLDKKPSGPTNPDLAVRDQGPAVDLGSDNSNLAFK